MHPPPSLQGDGGEPWQGIYRLQSTRQCTNEHDDDEYDDDGCDDGVVDNYDDGGVIEALLHKHFFKSKL